MSYRIDPIIAAEDKTLLRLNDNKADKLVAIRTKLLKYQGPTSLTKLVPVQIALALMNFG